MLPYNYNSLTILSTFLKKTLAPVTDYAQKTIGNIFSSQESGYSELSDSLYYALAIVNGAIFVTNDFKHVAHRLIDLVMWKTV